MRVGSWRICRITEFVRALLQINEASDLPALPSSPELFAQNVGPPRVE